MWTVANLSSSLINFEQYLRKLFDTSHAHNWNDCNVNNAIVYQLWL